MERPKTSHDGHTLPSAGPGPGVGLALGGGAARGLAHIGVIQELEARGLSITHLAGCSMGAVVAAAYACGTLDRLVERTRGLQYPELVRWIRFNGGILDGDRVYRELQDLTGALTFDDLPVELVLVATDLATGEPVRLDRGEVARAVQASMSVPGLLPPVSVNGRWLVDGGLVELVPVGPLAEMGAEYRVAVDVSNRADIWGRLARAGRVAYRQVRGHDRLASCVQGHAFSSGQRAWSTRSTLAHAFEISEARAHWANDGTEGTENPPLDCVLHPDLSRYHGHQFHEVEELIEAGRQAVRRASQHLPPENAACARSLGGNAGVPAGGTEAGAVARRALQ
ncbi:patatin-like phospholipase family protein [Limnochorda pilosa]|uniref:Patatin n=1 Tax=Limnochorda pilosa TaxID=1555112 RepID=A0A0K2SHK8_LIMPI|nr:patatin-like phospholipase family protein [Limnochorda pilosa]BAS26601.1 patatin [Limnochorda pilosa]